VYIQSMRGTGDSQIFTGAAVPAGFNALTSQTHRLIVNGFYVSRSSSLGAGVPSLRVQTLADGGVMTLNQELIAGVEDLQVQFGVDTDAPDTPDRGSIDRYVNINDPMVDPTNAGFNPNAQILAARIWVRVRAERGENGFTDTANYVYADQNVGPFNDAFRRMVVSKTIYLRNSRPPS
jgi:type IV pilus assembly protein PilW